MVGQTIYNGRCLEKCKILLEEYNKKKDPSLLWKRSYYYLMLAIGILERVKILEKIMELSNEGDKKDIELLLTFCKNEKNANAFIPIHKALISDNIEEIFAKTTEKYKGEKATVKCVEILTDYIIKNEKTLKKKNAFLNIEALKTYFIPYLCKYPEFMLDAIQTAKGKGTDITELLRKD